MKFSEWLNQHEGLYREPGSFDPKTFVFRPNQAPEKQPMQQQQPGRQDNRFQRIDQRVKYGKGIEKQIFDSLVACGLQLREPTAQEDMFAKIDAWWTTGGKEAPIQIKYRDTGSDILFEVMKDYWRGVPGRDMIGKAKFYAVMVNNKISIVEVEEAKTLINKAVEKAINGGFDERGNYVGPNGLTLRVRPDPQSGQEKLMAYVPVSLLKNVHPPCNASVSF